MALTSTVLADEDRSGLPFSASATSVKSTERANHGGFRHGLSCPVMRLDGHVASPHHRALRSAPWPLPKRRLDFSIVDAETLKKVKGEKELTELLQGA